MTWRMCARSLGMVPVLLVAALSGAIGCGGSPGPKSDANADGALSGDAIAPDASGVDAAPVDGRVDDGAVPADAGVGLATALVQTQSGPIQGFREAGLSVFLGIPYAAPPVGPLRWWPPEPPVPWSETRSATAFGPTCPQAPGPRPVDVVGEPSADCPADCQGDYCCRGQEDCLTANVWTPALSENDALPVLVRIHGGGWSSGGSTLPILDGAHLARSGPAVVVTFNYRLGPLGFLAHPLLTAESPHAASGNYGLLDQVRLLVWVQQNIRAFGGDPNNVTVFGESAGGGSICYLIASPLAAGLFARAFIESIGCASEIGAQYLDQAPYGGQSAEDQGLAAAAALGCDAQPDPLACLRSKPVGEIFLTLEPAPGGFFGGDKYWPIVDGYFVSEAPLAAMQAGRHNPVDVIGGTNGNEMGLWRPVTIALLGGSGVTLADADDTVDPARFATAVTLLFGLAHRNEFLALYPTPTTGSEAVLAYESLVNDLTFVCPTRRYLRAIAAAGGNTYRYVFTRVPPQSYAGLEQFGAVHGAEVPYVFGTLAEAPAVWQPMAAEDTTVSEAIQRYLLRYAATGDPSGGADPTWPLYDLANDPYLQFDVPLSVGQGLRSAQCDAMDAFLASDACNRAPPLPLACKN